MGALAGTLVGGDKKETHAAGRTAAWEINVYQITSS